MKHQTWTLAILVIATVALAAQQESPAPNPLGQPLVDAAGKVRDEAILRTPLLPEDRKYADLDGHRMKQFVMEVDAISLKDRDSGNLFWGRNVGTAGHLATQDWVEAYFRQHGLQNVHRMPFDLQPVWTPKSWDIDFPSGGRTFKLPSARPAARAASTPAGGLELEIVWVGGGAEADYIGRDVKGKAVLVHDIPLPGDIRHTDRPRRLRRARLREGRCRVGIVFGISDNFAIWQAAGGRPGFDLGYEDGMKIRELIGKGEAVKVKLQLDAEMRPGLKTASVIGTLPGQSDEDITILAHMDGYFQASLDNASGLAVMIGLLEHYRPCAACGTAPRHPLHRLGRPSWRPWCPVVARPAGNGAGENGAGDQPRARRGRAYEVLGSAPADDDRGLPDALVGERQPALARHLARRVPAVQRRHHGRHRSGCLGRGRIARARRADDAGDHVARDQAHRAGHTRVGALSRPRADRARLREDHR